MLDFLKKYNISQDIIDEIEKKYSDSLVYCLNTNKLEIEKIINYFNTIGIKNIDELLLEKIYIFTKTFDDLKKIFEKYNVEELANFINVDSIDMLFE